jgi:hypothetical protein
MLSKGSGDFHSSFTQTGCAPHGTQGTPLFQVRPAHIDERLEDGQVLPILCSGHGPVVREAAGKFLTR